MARGPKRNPNAERTAQRADAIERRVAAGELLKDVAAEMGISYVTACLYRSKAKRAAGIPSMKAEPGWVSKSRVPRIQALRSEGKTLSEICAELGIGKSSVEADLAAAGLCKPMPPRLTAEQIAEVDCMLHRGVRSRAIAYHLGVSYSRIHKRALRIGRAKKRPPRPPFSALEIERVWTAILAADRPARDIAQEIGRSREQVSFHIRRLVRSGALSEAEVTRRKFRRRARRPTRKAAFMRLPAAGAASRDPLFARIWSALPASIVASVGQDHCFDIAQEIYLAVLDGRIDAAEVEDFAWTIAAGQRSSFANEYGPKSLDTALGADDERTLGMLIGDDYGVGLIEDMHIGDGEW